MQILTDLLPILLFFISYKLAGIYAATTVAIISTLLLIAYSQWRFGRVDKMLMINGVLISVLGGVTLLLHDKTYIMWKPTVLYWIAALVLVVGRYLFKQNFIQKMFSKLMAPPVKIWDRLNWLWFLFLVGLGVLNLYVATHYSENTWVNFKLFGTTLLMFTFVVGQMLLLRKYLLIEEDNS